MDEAKKGDASYVTADVRTKVKSVTLSDEEIRRECRATSAAVVPTQI